ncbi:MAG: sugar transferase [Granulosicoccus sp.]
MRRYKTEHSASGLHVEPARKMGTFEPDHSEGTPLIIEAGQTSTAESANTLSQGLRPVSFRPTLYNSQIKPAVDRLAACCALAVFALPMLLIATVVLISMGRPVLFRQQRVGLNGRVFKVLKFRTMGKDRRTSEMPVVHDKRFIHKSDTDPRHTPVGRFLRKYSLDELPQLVNIARGDMSIVGPRPELESVVRKQYPTYLDQRHLVKPGLTGLWQISARGEGPMHENGSWDLDYVEQISLLTDLKIVLKTPKAMFSQKHGH